MIDRTEGDVEPYLNWAGGFIFICRIYEAVGDPCIFFASLALHSGWIELAFSSKLISSGSDLQAFIWRWPL